MIGRTKYPAIQQPIATLASQHATSLQIKEAVEIGLRLRGDPLDSFIRLREMQSLGLIRVVGKQIYPAEKILVTGTTGTQTATFTATNKPGLNTSAPVAWIPVVTTSGVEGYVPVFGK
jgi:hypothetical protein